LLPFEDEYKEFRKQAKEIKNAAEKNNEDINEYRKELNPLLKY